MMPILPGGHRPLGLNRRWRCYRYVPGAVYRPHVDGAWPSSGVDGDGKYVYDAFEDGRASRLTFLIYLNDDFQGGCTTFFTPSALEPGVLDARGLLFSFSLPLSPSLSPLTRALCVRVESGRRRRHARQWRATWSRCLRCLGMAKAGGQGRRTSVRRARERASSKERDRGVGAGAGGGEREREREWGDKLTGKRARAGVRPRACAALVFPHGDTMGALLHEVGFSILLALALLPRSQGRLDVLPYHLLLSRLPPSPALARAHKHTHTHTVHSAHVC